MSRWDAQPTDLSYAPPSYPGHDYTGEGTVVVVRVDAGKAGVVGWLTRQGEAVGFLPAPMPAGAVGHVIRVYIQDALREGARIGAPLDKVWDAILAEVWHDEPTIARLDGLQG